MPTADAILVEMGRRLTLEFPEPATTARLGGDEFAVLLPGIGEPDAMLAANRLRVLLEEPVDVRGDQLAVGASVGVATVPRGTHPESVLQRADLAMYAAKRSDHGPRTWAPPASRARTAGRTPLARRTPARRCRTGEIGIALSIRQISPRRWGVRGDGGARPGGRWPVAPYPPSSWSPPQSVAE